MIVQTVDTVIESYPNSPRLLTADRGDPAAYELDQ